MSNRKFNSKKIQFTLIFLSLLLIFTHVNSGSSKPTRYLMIQQKTDLLQTIKRSKIAVFFYGQINTKQYQQYQSMLIQSTEMNNQYSFPNIQFYLIPSNKFKLSRPNPSLSIYRQIKNGQWLLYKGVYSKQNMKQWIKQNCYDPLVQLSAEQIDSYFVDSKKGFILLDFGQFDLLKVKIMINQFCNKFSIKCGKVTLKNTALNVIIQLMRAQNQPGIPKLGFWNPQTQKLQIYTKDPSQITENQLMELYSGHEAILPYQSQLDVAEIIHPSTIFIQNQNNQNNQL